MELSYEFDTLNLLSASFGVNGGSYKQPNNISQTYMRDWNGDTISAYNSITNTKNSYIGFSGNIDYQRTFKKPEQLFTISYLFDLSPDNSENISIVKLDTNYSNILNTKELNQKFIKLGNTDEHTFQLDYTEPFKDGKHVIAGGIKYILRKNKADNDYKLYNDLTGEYDLDTARIQNDMLYYQHIFGAYASYTFKLKKFSARVGGRLEGTLQDVQFLDHTQDNFTAKFLDFIPSISLNYKPTDKSNFRLSYNNGISRPNIWYLNPYIDDSNQYSIDYGNPDLKSERSHNITFNYGYVAQKFNMNISASYRQINNSIENYTFIDDNGIINSTYANIGKYRSLGGNLYLNYNPWKWLRMWGQANGSYSEYQNNDYTNGNFRVYAYAGLNFTLPWKLKFNVVGGGATPWSGYQNTGSTWYYYYFSLQRSFLKGDKLNVSIFAQDPFEKYKSYTGKSWNTGIYENNSTSKQLGRLFGISVSWQFGEMKAQIKKAERGISNDDVKSGGGGNSGGGGGQ
jgi:outer membrane receptor protein involved in Fe transport